MSSYFVSDVAKSWLLHWNTWHYDKTADRNVWGEILYLPMVKCRLRKYVFRVFKTHNVNATSTVRFQAGNFAACQLSPHVSHLSTVYSMNKRLICSHIFNLWVCQCVRHTPEALVEVLGDRAWVCHWALTGKSHSRIFSVSPPRRGKPLWLGGSAELQSPATARHPPCSTPQRGQMKGHWGWKHSGVSKPDGVCDEWMNSSFKSHLTVQRALSKTALICSSCPWSRLWQQHSRGLGKWVDSLMRMFMYSEGGVMATKAFDAITLTL